MQENLDMHFSLNTDLKNEGLIYVAGLAGSGMIVLAAYLAVKGFRLIGSDRLFDMGKADGKRSFLENLGVKIVGEKFSVFEKSVFLLIRSAAVEDSTPLIEGALEKGVPVISRSEILAQIVNNGYSICVAGTSGKTTTATIIGHVLKTSGRKPAVFTGSEGEPYFQKDIEELFVVESDESDGKLHLYRPDIGIVLNITRDHFKLEKLTSMFKDFCFNSKKCFVNYSCHGLIDCGLVYTSDHSVMDSFEDKTGITWTKFMLEGEVYDVPLFGRHNVENCVAAIKACVEFGIELSIVKKALLGLPVIKRRLEFKGKRGKTKIYDDFAHNPAKINASIRALKERHKNIFIAFRPHGFGPLKLFGLEIARIFADLLGQKDCLHLFEVFYTGGTIKETQFNSKWLEELVKSFNNDLTVTSGELNWKSVNLSQYDAFITMGARDPFLGKITDEIIEK
ncbi:hypothetical protein JXA84_00170 [candidate division WOR-3 bacterium]|nr:hypothetical protein [candidate division WOR-3 bacterium]